MQLKKVTAFTLTDNTKHRSTFGGGYDDMLRYDGAFVNEKMPNVVIFPHIKDKDGTFKRSPTFDRWKSFSYSLTPITGEKLYDVESDFKSHPRDWFTLRRKNGSADAELVRHTLQAHLDATRLLDLDEDGRS